MSTTNLPQVVTVQPVEDRNEDNEPPPQLYESFHEAVGPVLFFGHFFGLIPCENILQKDEKKLEFRWKSPRTIYSLLFLILGSIECFVGWRRLFRRGLYNIHFAEFFLFLTTAIIKCLMMFRLGRNWREIMVKWRGYENVFLQHPYEYRGMKLKTKIRIAGAFFISFVLAEHIFFLAKSMEENRLLIDQCTPKSEDFWQNFLWRYRPHLIYNFPYSPLELPLYEWINLLQAVGWSFSDILIIMLAMGVKFRFNQFNLRFRMISRDESLMTDLNFRKMRIHYFKLVDLVYYIDSQVSSLILLSLGHNMLVIMVQVFSALNSNRHLLLDDIYFWFYMVFLLVRVYSTLASCAGMHQSAITPLVYFGDIPSSKWTIDLSRLQDVIIIEKDTLGFSGKKFFYISKGLMLTFLGTIVTFELVLLDQLKEEKPPFCYDVEDY